MPGIKVVPLNREPLLTPDESLALPSACHQPTKPEAGGTQFGFWPRLVNKTPKIAKKANAALLERKMKRIITFIIPPSPQVSGREPALCKEPFDWLKV